MIKIISLFKDNFIKKNLLLSLSIALTMILQVGAYADTGRLGAGYEHSGFIDKDGKLWMWGNNTDRQLGLDSWGRTDNQFVPYYILNDAKSISLGFSLSALIKTDDTLWIAGNNRYEQINGWLEWNSGFKKIMDDVAFVSIGNGTLVRGSFYEFILVIKKDGSLWAWGSNWFGQFCNGQYGEYIRNPTKIMDDVKAVYAGYGSSAIVKKDGTLLMCGNNREGRLGLGSYFSDKNGEFDNIVPYPTELKFLDNNGNKIPIKQVNFRTSTTYFLLEDGTVWYAGTDYCDDNYTNTVLPVKFMDNIRLIRGNYMYTQAFITNDDVLYLCGSNFYGELGIGYKDSVVYDIRTELRLYKVMENVEDIQVGENYSIALSFDGNLYSWGSNEYGQCGLGKNKDPYDYSIVSPSIVEFKLAIKLLDPDILNENDIRRLKFNGREQTIFLPGFGYSVSGNTGKEVGWYTVILTPDDGYEWEDGTNLEKIFHWEIIPGINPLTVSVKKISVKAKRLKTKGLREKKVLDVKRYEGELYFQKLSGNKKIIVNEETGAIKIKKGLKKGTYNVEVQVIAIGNENYEAGSKTVTVKVVVK